MPVSSPFWAQDLGENWRQYVTISNKMARSSSSPGRRQKLRNPQSSVSTVSSWMPKYANHPCADTPCTMEILMTNHIEDVLQQVHFL